MDPEEAECHHMGTPFGPCATGTAAGSDAAAIKHDRNIVGSFRLTGLTGHHCSAEMEAWLKGTVTKRRTELENTTGIDWTRKHSSLLYFI